MQHKSIEAVEGTIVQDLEPIIVRASVQLMIPTEKELFCMFMNKFDLVNQSINNLTERTEESRRISVELNPSDFEVMCTKLDAISDAFGAFPEWIPASHLQESTGLGADAIRKQLKNYRIFEPEVDYKQVGRIWYVHKSAISKIRRQK